MTALAAPAMTESELLACVRQCARLFGWLTYHTWSSRFSEKGFPDLTCIRASRVLFAELKSEKGKLSTAQVQWLDSIATAGIECYVWRPADWLDGTIERTFRGEGAGAKSPSIAARADCHLPAIPSTERTAP